MSYFCLEACWRIGLRESSKEESKSISVETEEV